MLTHCPITCPKRQLFRTLDERHKMCYNYFTPRSWSQRAFLGTRNSSRI